MTLQTHLDPAFRVQTSRIEHRAPQLDVGLPGTMAALAIDSGGQPAVRLGWISVMAEDAGVRNLTAKVAMVRTVVTGTHGPITAPLGIPTHRQFEKPARVIAVQKCQR